MTTICLDFSHAKLTILNNDDRNFECFDWMKLHQFQNSKGMPPL